MWKGRVILTLPFFVSAYDNFNKKEIHIVYLAVNTCRIHAGEMATGTQVREVFSVYADQLQPKVSVSERKLVVSFVQAGLFLNIFLDAGLYIGCYHFGAGRRRFPCFILPAARKRNEYHHRCR